LPFVFEKHVEELVISEFPQVVKGDGPGTKVIGPGLEDVSLALSMAATDFPKVIDAGGLRSEVLEHAKNAVITPTKVRLRVFSIRAWKR